MDQSSTLELLLGERHLSHYSSCGTAEASGGPARSPGSPAPALGLHVRARHREAARKGCCAELARWAEKPTTRVREVESVA